MYNTIIYLLLYFVENPRRIYAAYIAFVIDIISTNNILEESKIIRNHT